MTNRQGATHMGRFTRVFFGALCAAVAFAGALTAPAGAQESGRAEQGRASDRHISMGVGKSIILDLPRDAAEIVVGNPKVANAVVRTPRKIYLMGADAGQTTLFAIDHEGRQIASYEISIGRDVGELGPLLKAALPNSNIAARTVNDTIILTGSVASPGDAKRAVDLAKGFASRLSAEGGVVNALTISGEDQVMVKVTIAEVSRKVTKQLGFGTSGAADTLLQGGWGALTQQNSFPISGPLSAGAATFKGPNGTQATLKAFERYGVSRLLAEPTLTSVSGEAAKMLVGGEVPISGGVSCGGAGVCTPIVIFKPYGVSLAFTPIVMSEGRIQMHIATEVTEGDYSRVGVGGTPGFQTRRNDTTIELPSGGTLATAGLLKQMSSSAIEGLPGLGNLPVLGALFRSRDYQREESELLIMVTPYVVRPVSAKDVVRPDEGWADANDPQGWLLGRVNRIYSSRGNPQIMNNFKGRVGFIHD
jgi:pilus assembly protein CpaC